jgi:hypothetical protein
MLYALRQPATLLGLLLGFAVGSALRVSLQQAFIGGLRSVRKVSNTQVWLDPYGLVAALIGGVGWSPRPTVSRFKPRQVWTMVVVAVGVHAVLAAVGLTLYLAAGGTRLAFPFVTSVAVLHGTQLIATGFAQRIALGFAIENLGCGLLALLPIPPLELGVAVWSTFPKTANARRLAYRVLEEHWGVLIILVLLILPLAGEAPLLLQLVGSLSDRIVNAL